MNVIYTATMMLQIKQLHPPKTRHQARVYI